MKKSTLFCIVLAISLVISVFVVPSPKLNVREMQAIDEMDTGRMNRSHQIEPMKYLQYKASGWGVFALTAVLTAVLFPVASIFAKSDDDENRGKSLAQIEGKNPKQPKASDEEISGLSSEILSFFKTELEKRFKSVTIHKMFFEIGEYWNENEEECADFHLVIAPDGESDEAGDYIDANDTNCIRYQGFSPLKTYALEYCDAVKIAKNVVQDIKLHFNFTGYTLADDFKIFDLQEYS